VADVYDRADQEIYLITSHEVAKGDADPARQRPPCPILNEGRQLIHIQAADLPEVGPKDFVAV
jgi:hypothetical protein